MTFDEVEVAIKHGDVVHLRHALEAGLDPDTANQYSWTILMIAAMNGNTEVGRLLIASGADLERRNKFGDTALSLAVQTGHPSFVRLLLISGASLECDPDGNSLDIFLNWVQKSCGVTEQQTKHIRELFETERRLRASSSAS